MNTLYICIFTLHIYTLYIYYIYTIYTLCIHYIYTTYTHYIYTIYTLYIHYIYIYIFTLHMYTLYIVYAVQIVRMVCIVVSILSYSTVSHSNRIVIVLIGLYDELLCGTCTSMAFACNVNMAMECCPCRWAPQRHSMMKHSALL